MAEFPALPLWTDAYLGDTMHLDATEHGAYLLLLISAWRSESTTLPNDDRLLARYARCTPKTWARIRPIIAEFFTVSDSTWAQLRLSEEKFIVTQKRDAAAANGRLSALKRKKRHSTKRPTEREQSDQLNGNEATNGSPTPTPISTPVVEEDRESPSTPVDREILCRMVSIAARTAGIALKEPSTKSFEAQIDIVRRWAAMPLDFETEIIPMIEQDAVDQTEPRFTLNYFTPFITRLAARKDAAANGKYRKTGARGAVPVDGFTAALRDVASRET